MSKKSVLITGANGYLGGSLVNALSKNFNVTPTSARPDSENTFKGLNLINLNETKLFIDEHNFDVIINCAGQKNISLCEAKTKIAYDVNYRIVENLVSSKKPGCQFLQISSDYVYSGNKKEPAPETHGLDPDTAYGLSKAMAELYCGLLDESTQIVRVAGVYSENEGFVKTLIDEFSKGHTFSAFSNRLYSPIYIKAFCEGISQIISRPVKQKIIHLVGASISRYAMAHMVLSIGKFSSNLLLNQNQGNKVENRALATSSVITSLNLRYLDHKEAIRDIFSERMANETTK
jgi:dTDP-4-dehydrorhamnose reductase